MQLLKKNMKKRILLDYKKYIKKDVNSQNLIDEVYTNDHMKNLNMKIQYRIFMI